VLTSLCAGIGIDNDGANLRDGTWQEIRGVEVKEGNYLAQGTQFLRGVHVFLEVGRDVAP